MCVGWLDKGTVEFRSRVQSVRPITAGRLPALTSIRRAVAFTKKGPTVPVRTPGGRGEGCLQELVRAFCRGPWLDPFGCHRTKCAFSPPAPPQIEHAGVASDACIQNALNT